MSEAGYGNEVKEVWKNSLDLLEVVVVKWGYLHDAPPKLPRSNPAFSLFQSKRRQNSP